MGDTMREGFEASYRMRFRVRADVPLTFPDVEEAWCWWQAAHEAGRQLGMEQARREQAVPDDGQSHGQLDPRSASDFARTIIGFSDSFNGQTFSSVFDSVDRQNLAMALDHLTEAGAMLLNLADRVTECRPLTEGELWRLVEDLPDSHGFNECTGAEFRKFVRAVEAAQGIPTPPAGDSDTKEN